MEKSLTASRMAIAQMLVTAARVTLEALTEECLMKGPFTEEQAVLEEPAMDGEAPRS